MAVIQHRPCFSARCDVCGAAPDEDYHWDDPQVAVDYLAEDDDWTLTDRGQLVCHISDAVHDAMRGGESPAELAPGTDAMTVGFTAA